MLQSGPRGFPEDKTVSEELATGKAISFKDSHVPGSGGGGGGGGVRKPWDAEISGRGNGQLLRPWNTESLPH
jgi:hypothetical protein